MEQSWLENLNTAQHAAATHGDGGLLIVAGAGTGKTATLTARVAQERIMLLTFTCKSSAELLRRVRHMSGRQEASRLVGNTFQVLAVRLLRQQSRQLELPSAPDLIIRSDLSSAEAFGDN